jgi:hypothetical protein
VSNHVPRSGSKWFSLSEGKYRPQRVRNNPGSLVSNSFMRESFSLVGGSISSHFRDLKTIESMLFCTYCITLSLLSSFIGMWDAVDTVWLSIWCQMSRQKLIPVFFAQSPTTFSRSLQLARWAYARFCSGRTYNEIFTTRWIALAREWKSRRFYEPSWRICPEFRWHAIT